MSHACFLPPTRTGTGSGPWPAIGPEGSETVLPRQLSRSLARSRAVTVPFLSFVPSAPRRRVVMSRPLASSARVPDGVACLPPSQGSLLGAVHAVLEWLPFSRSAGARRIGMVFKFVAHMGRADVAALTTHSKRPCRAAALQPTGGDSCASSPQRAQPRMPLVLFSIANKASTGSATIANAGPAGLRRFTRATLHVAATNAGPLAGDETATGTWNRSSRRWHWRRALHRWLVGH